LLFCKKNFCYENFVFMFFTIVTNFTTIVNFTFFCCLSKNLSTPTSLAAAVAQIYWKWPPYYWKRTKFAKNSVLHFVFKL